MSTRGQSPCVVILGSPVKSAGHIAPLLLVSSVTEINVVSAILSKTTIITLHLYLKKVAVPCSFPASYILSSESPWGVVRVAGQ